jgi:hypothetical protein
MMESNLLNNMNAQERREEEYDALQTVSDRAAWILGKGIKAVMCSVHAGVTLYEAESGGIRLSGEYNSKAEAIEWWTDRLTKDLNSRQ